MKVIRWAEIVRDEDALHVAYVSQSEAGSWQMHGHDFFELIWIDSGRGKQFCGEDGKRSMLLRSGQIGFLGPRHVHSLEAEASTEPFAFINVAFPSADWRELRSRYDLSEHQLLGEQGEVPALIDVSGDAIHNVASLFRDLLHAPRTHLSRDSFLLSLARVLGGDLNLAGLGAVPASLRRALHACSRDVELLRGGPAELARQAGFSLPHMTRTMRASLGITPSAWILGERLRRAQRLLEATGFSIAEVSFEAGFENLSHFHRCFKSELGETPLQFRKSKARAIV